MFNTQLYDMHSHSNATMQVAQLCWGASGTTILKKIPGIPWFSGKSEKFKWLYGSIETFDTLMQEFYRIVKGRNEKVQTFVLHLEWALKVIRQQHPYAMTEEEGVKHLKDHLFHGCKPNLCNALHYMYDKPDSQYSQLVMASRKAETETPESSVSEARVKSGVVGMDTALQAKGVSSEASYEALTQEIAYLMSAVTNQTNQNDSKNQWTQWF